MIRDETSVSTLADNWPYAFQDPTENEAFRTLLTTFAEDVARLDRAINAVYENRFIESATGRELAKLGSVVGVTRRAGEDDETLRYRVRLSMAVAASTGTAEDIEAVIDAAFGADALDKIGVETSADTPELLFLIPPQKIDAIPISQARVGDRLNQAMPAGTGVQVISDEDVFTFRSDAADAEDYEAGFGEGVWTN